MLEDLVNEVDVVNGEEKFYLLSEYVTMRRKGLSRGASYVF
jgi:hypothetical protein